VKNKNGNENADGGIEIIQRQKRRKN